MAGLVEDAHGQEGHVVIAGFGRVGQMVARLLDEHHQTWIALEINPHTVTHARRSGLAAHYGDGTRTEVLEAAGLARARALVVAIDVPEDAERAVAAARAAHPDIPVVTRARDTEHAGRLAEAGATEAVPETVEASLTLSARLLHVLGVEKQAVLRLVERIRRQGTIDPPSAPAG
jgi:CPA2 family monovalent cation:H+ antiporter-2